jgi:hypothetical protein
MARKPKVTAGRSKTDSSFIPLAQAWLRFVPIETVPVPDRELTAEILHVDKSGLGSRRRPVLSKS